MGGRALEKRIKRLKEIEETVVIKTLMQVLIESHKGGSSRKKGEKLPAGVRYRERDKSYSVYDSTVTGVKKKMTDLSYKLDYGVFVVQCKSNIRRLV